MKKIIIWILIGMGVISLLVGGYYLFYGEESNQFVKLFKLYDADGNEITASKSNKGIFPTKAVVNEVEGVKYISLQITVNNLDTVPLDLVLTDLTPAEAKSSMPQNQITVQAGQLGIWVTDLIDIEPYEGMTQNFCVSAKSLAIPALRLESEPITGCTSLIIESNPTGNFDIIIDSSIGDGGINPSCTESWSCTEWGSCNNGLQTRTCTDDNNCGTTSNKPVEEQACQPSFVEFRTTDLSYKTGAIAYAYNGCGNDLYAYEVSIVRCSDITCEQHYLDQADLKGLPTNIQGLTTYGFIIDETSICICLPEYLQTTKNPMKFIRYSSSANKIPTASTPIGGYGEKYC